jgi:hypothetical protein
VLLRPQPFHRVHPRRPAGQGRSRRSRRIAFNNNTKRLLVTNHASLTGLPDPSFLFAVFDVYVNDKAGKLFKDDDDD